MRKRNRGFTLIELAVVIAIVGIAAIVASVYMGRFFVEDTDAVRAATNAGYENARVVERHNIWARWRGCTSDDAVAFDLEAINDAGGPVRVTVCCGSWFRGCEARAAAPAAPSDAGAADAGTTPDAR